MRYEQVNLFQALQFEHARDIAQAAIEEFIDGRVDSVYLVYNEFKSVIPAAHRRRAPAADPAARHRRPGAPARRAAPHAIDYLYEPTPEELFTTLLPRHVEVQVFRALLESNAAFYAAQMTAMDAATRNSADMIEQLTLYMNKVRQAAITREIIEVVSGAQAL